MPIPSAVTRPALASLALFLLATFPAQAQDTSRIARVTVYPGSATVERLAKVPAGARSLTLACLPGIVSARGGILNVASTAAFVPGPGMAVYYASKAFVLSFSEALYQELRPAGVRVTALCPGATRTDFAATAGYQRLLKPSAERFAQTPDQVAEAAIRGNDAGRLIVIPGWTNRLAVALMGALPEPLVRAVIDAGAAKYRLPKATED